MSWSVNIFPVRKKSLFSRRRKTKGYGWSASCTTGGYKYDRTPQPSAEAALRVATKEIEAMGGIVAHSNAVTIEPGDPQPTDS